MSPRRKHSFQKFDQMLCIDFQVGVSGNPKTFDILTETLDGALAGLDLHHIDPYDALHTNPFRPEILI
jgi:hypothetical protein